MDSFYSRQIAVAVVVVSQAGGVDYGSSCRELRGFVHCRNGVRLLSTHGHGGPRATPEGMSAFLISSTVQRTVRRTLPVLFF